MKTFRLGLVPVLLASLCGCVTFLTEILVARDGSGTLVQTFAMNPQAMMGAMQEVAKGMGGSGEVKETTSEKKTEKGAFSKADLAAKAKELGEGVTLVSAEPIEKADAQGMRAIYKFADISRVFVNPKPAAALGTEGAGQSSKNAMHFKFERRGDRSILTAVLPPSEKKPSPPPPAAPADVDESQLAMIRQMFKGMHVRLSIDVEGKIVATNAAHRTGSQVTVMDLDFDPLLAKPDTLKALNARFSEAAGDDARMAAELSKLPGIQIDLQPEIRIEFSGS
jgi:hypothetical protein